VKHYPYIIIGGGMTADAAVSGIRENDGDGEIAMFSRENHAPYDRPPLTKGLWRDTTLEEIWRKTELKPGVELHLGTSIQQLDPAGRIVRDAAGREYQYDRLLLATGGRPRRLPFDAPDIVYFRTLDDYHRIRTQAAARSRVAVLGGGFIGSELAASLTMNGCEVVMIFPEPGIGSRQFPEELARFLTDYYREKGVQVEPGQRVQAVQRKGSRYHLTSQAGREWVADSIVAGLGMEPETQLAEQAGLATGDGIRVNGSLQSSDPLIYAAGDAVSFPAPGLDRWLRCEHEDNANSMGHHAGLGMTGECHIYTHLPMFYSDLFDLGYEAVGTLRADLETVARWEEPLCKGVVYYLDNQRVVGVLLWNVWQQVEAARVLIDRREPVSAGRLRNRLPI
jgi:NADPH-dependent 2,4-dienoyl-CoA reductase/sulfur reductase-like enzyme